MEEIVIKLEKPKTKRPTWRCLNCGGLGTMMNGSCLIGLDEIRIKPATKCWICKGKGRVYVSAVPDEDES